MVSSNERLVHEWPRGGMYRRSNGMDDSTAATQSSEQDAGENSTPLHKMVDLTGGYYGPYARLEYELHYYFYSLAIERQ